MTVDEALAAWLAAGSGPATLVGSWSQTEQAAAALSAAGVAVRSANHELLARLGPGDHRLAQQRALREAYEQWLAELATEPGPLAIGRFELLVAEHLDLTRLADLRRPVLLLAPGRLDGRAVRLYATPEELGWPWPPALAPRERCWQLESAA
ncbi:MAG: hypothetical protein IT204_22935 [Fimbriimonadaceae bacterium]|nr:hypothetical protein [Fimbriimonadaceae bacterium]